MSTDRRGEKERRKNRVYVEFPLKDADGSMITEDRRRNPDRRRPIILSEADLSEEEFEMYFKPVYNK